MGRVIDDAVLDRLARPLAEASGLPSGAYTDADFHALEQEKVFRRSWVIAGFRHQIPAPGDVLPVEVAGLPVVLVHDRDGTIRVFHNVCPHRGTQLVWEATHKLRAITCPYHNWSYGLDGSLKMRPHFFGPDRHDTPAPGEGAVCLSEVRCGTWFDLIFVNLSGSAPPLDDFLAPVTARMATHDVRALRHAGGFSCEIAANWKFAVENFIEPYHVFAVHPRLINFAPMEVRSPSKAEGQAFYNEYEFPAPEAGRGDGLPHYPGLGAADRRRGFWMHLFPSLSFEVYPDQFTLMHLVPLGPDRTREEFHVYLVGEAATSDDYKSGREDVIRTWRDLNDEDIGVVEALQRGRKAEGYGGGAFSPHWDEAPRHFSRLVAEAVTAA